MPLRTGIKAIIGAMTSDTPVANNTMELTSYLNGFGDLQQQVNTGTLADDITRLLRHIIGAMSFLIWKLLQHC